MSEIYIQYDNEFIHIDINTLKFIENASNFKYSRHCNCSENTSICITIGDIKIYVSKFNNPQIRTGFYHIIILIIKLSIILYRFLLKYCIVTNDLLISISYNGI